VRVVFVVDLVGDAGDDDALAHLADDGGFDGVLVEGEIGGARLGDGEGQGHGEGVADGVVGQELRHDAQVDAVFHAFEAAGHLAGHLVVHFAAGQEPALLAEAGAHARPRDDFGLAGVDQRIDDRRDGGGPGDADRDGRPRVLRVVLGPLQAGLQADELAAVEQVLAPAVALGLLRADEEHFGFDHRFPDFEHVHDVGHLGADQREDVGTGRFVRHRAAQIGRVAEDGDLEAFHAGVAADEIGDDVVGRAGVEPGEVEDLFAERVGDLLHAIDVDDGREAAVEDDALVGFVDADAGDVRDEVVDLEGDALERRRDDHDFRHGRRVGRAVGEERAAGREGRNDDPVAIRGGDGRDARVEDPRGRGIVQRADRLLPGDGADGGHGGDFDGLRLRVGREARGEGEQEQGNGEEPEREHLHGRMSCRGWIPAEAEIISAWRS